ncbi:hypothetical protein HAZT_HAZT007528, partial [Hyalella azteca]
MVRRWDLPMLKAVLLHRKLQYSIHIADVHRHLADMKEKHLQARTRAGDARMSWDAYYNYDEVPTSREWIAPATVTYFIQQLVAGDGVGLLDDVDFYFMPSINPDGYAYTFTETRSPNPGSPCVGTDPNRNWSFHWM